MFCLDPLSPPYVYNNWVSMLSPDKIPQGCPAAYFQSPIYPKSSQMGSPPPLKEPSQTNSIQTQGTNIPQNCNGHPYTHFSLQSCPPPSESRNSPKRGKMSFPQGNPSEISPHISYPYPYPEIIPQNYSETLTGQGQICCSNSISTSTNSTTFICASPEQPVYRELSNNSNKNMPKRINGSSSEAWSNSFPAQHLFDAKVLIYCRCSNFLVLFRIFKFA